MSSLHQTIADTIRKHFMSLTDDELIAFALNHESPVPVAAAIPADDGETTKRIWECLNNAQKGLSSGELALKCTIPQPRLRTALRRLVSSGQVFVHGERRFARYAVSQEIAERDSLLARGVCDNPNVD